MGEDQAHVGEALTISPLSNSRLVPLALTVVAISAVTSVMGTVIQEQSWFLSVVGFALIGVVAAESARIARARNSIMLGAAVMALVLATHATFASDQSRWGWVPTWTSWRTVIERLNEGSVLISQSVPPAQPFPALIDLVSLCIAVVALTLYWTIAVTDRPLLAGLILFSSSIVPIVVLAEGAPLSSFLVLGATFLAILGTHQRHVAQSWGEIISHSGVQTLRINGGLRLGLLALSIGLIAPLVIPGLDEPVWRPGVGGIGGSGSNASASLLLDPEVSLRRQLTRPDDIEVLSYTTSDQSPNYLRIGALTEFDGTVWRRKQFIRLNDNSASAQLIGLPTDTPQVQYSVAIESLENRLLPLPYPALSVEGLSGRWSIDALTLTVFSDREAASGQNYTVNAFDVAPDPEDLRKITTTELEQNPPLGTKRDWLAYPADVDPEFLTITDEVIAGANTPYTRALAIQNWFRNSFTYSLSTAGDSSTSPLMSFINDRSGYCEQFAGAMALMARIAGIPSRVAIGFTSGTQSLNGEWIVTAHDAHAWPELWFPGHGWVRFEPTPRADAAAGVSVPAWAPAPDVNADQTERRGEQSGDGTTRDEQLPGGAEDPATDEAISAGNNSQQAANHDDVLRWVVLAVISLAGLIAVAIPGAIRQVRIRRRILQMRQELDTGIDAAWAELRDVFIDTAAPWRDSLTPRQSATALMTRISDQESRQALSDLVTTTERLRYAKSDSHHVTVNLEQTVKKISSALRKPLTGRQRLRLVLLPASVIGRQKIDHDGAGNAPRP